MSAVRYRLFIAAFALCCATASARGKDRPSVIRHQPQPDDLDERPVATEISVSPQGSDFAVKVAFDKIPWGEACKMRCANVTVFVDTDDSRATGLKLEKSAPESGADLAITIKGVRDYGASGTTAALKVQVRYLPDASKTLEDGELLAELDHQRDPERLQVEDRTAYVLVDATSAHLPTAKKARFIYHPPGTKALQAPTRGMLASGKGGGVKILKGGR